jgi:hypothetical protein
MLRGIQDQTQHGQEIGDIAADDIANGDVSFACFCPGNQQPYSANEQNEGDDIDGVFP